MEICLITGDHPRHKYFAKKLILSEKISGWVIESREKMIPQPPSELDFSLKQLFVYHFEERERVEQDVFFVDNVSIDLAIMKVDKKNLNSETTSKFINKLKPKLIISYGCHLLSDNFMKTVNCRFWNVHGGLSPYYRGVITHFWPSYFLEPQMTGMTLHETTRFLDAGSVIFQTAAPLVRGDTLHRLAARNVEYFTEGLTLKLSSLDFKKLPDGNIKKGYGKVFLSTDWRPEHLRLIYEIYEDKIVDAVLDKKLYGREPKLQSVL